MRRRTVFDLSSCSEEDIVGEQDVEENFYSEVDKHNVVVEIYEPPNDTTTGIWKLHGFVKISRLQEEL